jgi:hypothetical protein
MSDFAPAPEDLLLFVKQPSTNGMQIDSYAVIRYQVEGFHRWPQAPLERAYLQDRHRHVFHIEVKVQTFHDDREIEFHDLLAWAKATFPGGELGVMSCEVIARFLINSIALRFGGHRRAIVKVFEDGENGAELYLL